MQSVEEWLYKRAPDDCRLVGVKLRKRGLAADTFAGHRCALNWQSTHIQTESVPHPTTRALTHSCPVLGHSATFS